MLLSPPDTDDQYFFKESVEKYPSEFWSEILVSEIGVVLGFNVLKYDVGHYQGRLGCLSKNMVSNPNTSLYHGVDVLNDYVSDFIITKKPTYSFQQLMHLCESSNEFNAFKKQFIEMILLDSLIGNTDRHTENWSFIIDYSSHNKEKKDFDTKSQIYNLLLSLFRSEKSKGNIKDGMDIISETKFSFSPIYDSGSCLGREIPELKISEYLNNRQRIVKYLEKCNHEIQWINSRVNCFELVKNISLSERTIFRDIYTSSVQNLTDVKIKNLVENIDKGVPINYGNLNSVRKEFIVALLIERLKRLKEIGDAS